MTRRCDDENASCYCARDGRPCDCQCEAGEVARQPESAAPCGRRAQCPVAGTIARLRVALERMALGVRESRDDSHVACTGWMGHRATPECPRAEGCPAWDQPGTPDCIAWLLSESVEVAP